MVAGVGWFGSDLLGKSIGRGDGGGDDAITARGRREWAALIAPGLAIGEHLKLEDLSGADINLEFAFDATFMAAVGVGQGNTAPNGVVSATAQRIAIHHPQQHGLALPFGLGPRVGDVRAPRDF